MQGAPSRAIAVDWSGRIDRPERAIAVAECSSEGFVLHGKGMDREQVIEFLVAEADEDPRLVVGLDFSFSAPGWFLAEHGVSSGPEFWSVVTERGEGWLTNPEPPFFGPKGTSKPRDRQLFRQTEASLPGLAPKSFFQTAGAGAVGTMSIRGIPKLAELAEAGFRIWPFHDPEPDRPVVVEIYPRALTGVSGKRNREVCEKLLRDEFADLIEPGLRGIIASDEDLFDASVSAAVMHRHISHFANLPSGDRIEGQIWTP